MVLGIYLAIIGEWFGPVAGLIGFALFFTVRGNQIDFENKLYRDFIDLMGIKYGKWIALPEIEYVTMFHQNITQRGSVASIDSNFSRSKVKLKLIVSKTEHYNAGQFNTREEALHAAKLLAKNLACKLLDYTQREPKWIEVEQL